MSAPTRSFGRLSIGDNMPTTRSEAHRQRTLRPLEEEAPTSEEESSSVEEEPVDTTWQSPSSIVYDTSDLSPISRSRVKAGMRGNFRVDQCHRRSNKTLEVQIHEFGRVQIGEDGIFCTCSESSNENACKHAFVSNSIHISTPNLKLTFTSGS